MSADTPAPEAKSKKTATDADAVVETPADSTVVEPAASAPEGDAAGTVDAASDDAPASAYAGQQVVYVTAPIPPKVRSNRVVGVLLALLGAVIFAVAYAAIVALLLTLRVSSTFLSVSVSAFLSSAAFWVPVLVFTLAFILLVLIVNRAGWAAHVFGSLIVAFVVYFGTIGLLLVSGGLLFPDEAKNLDFASIASQPPVIVAALVAREVSIWIGLAISARGRRVKARNIETRTAWDQEQADQKAEVERAATPA
jgi:hypothetical protein